MLKIIVKVESMKIRDDPNEQSPSPHTHLKITAPILQGALVRRLMFLIVTRSFVVIAADRSLRGVHETSRFNFFERKIPQK